MEVQSQFIEMFDLSGNSKHWPVLKFNDFATLDCKMTTDFKFFANHPHIGIDSIEQNTGRLYGYRTVSEDNVKSGKYIFTPKHIIYSKIRPNLNKVAIPDFEGLCSADSYPVLANEKVTSRVFLAFLMRSEVFLDYIVPLSNRTGMPKANRDQVEGFTCPMPPKTEQDRFVAILEQADKSKFVGFKSQFIEMFGNPLAQIQKYQLKRLGDCCELNPRRPSITLSDTDMVSFVPMPSVSENGYLQDVADEEYGKVKKGFTYFENNDVLFAKITPCMENGKGAIAQDLTNGIGMGSTEFHVLRPIEGKSNSYWLLALTRMPIFRERASKNMSGTGGQKRVGAPFLDNFMVGLPPIDEQNRFEEMYKQADKSKYYNQVA